MQRPRLGLVLCLLVLWQLVPDPVQAGAVLAADVRGGLWKLGAQTPSRIRVGTLPAPFVALELDPSGDLWAMEVTGDLWRVDPETARGSRLWPAADGDLFEYRDLAIDDGGDLLVLRWRPGLDVAELVRVTPGTGDRAVIGELGTSSSPEASPFDPRTVVADGPNNVLLVDRTTIYRASLDELFARAIFDPVDFLRIADLGVDPESGTAWVLSERTEGAAGLELVGVGSQFFDAVDLTKPRYRFPFGLGPRAVVFQPPGDVCPQDSGTLCLQRGRFSLRAEWRDFDGNRGAGQVVVDRSETAGQFWFFSEDNRELMVKVIDGCTFNGGFWVFLAGTTNVEFDLTVTDLDTFDSRVYSNALGQTADTVLDTLAFPCSGGGFGAAIPGGLR